MRHGSSCAVAGSGEGEEEDVTDRIVRGGVNACLLHGLSWFPRFLDAVRIIHLSHTGPRSGLTNSQRSAITLGDPIKYLIK